jgi:hypothetical protein
LQFIGQLTCKLCSTGEVSTSSKTGCNTCSTIKGVNSFLDASNTCAYCQGCSKGSYKNVCDAFSTCKPCQPGKYKDTSETDSNTDTNQGSGWDRRCVNCSPCPAGSFRDNGDLCRFSNAVEDGLSKCTPCPDNTFKTLKGNWDDKCETCASCEVGSTRDRCGGISSGVCKAWQKPVVTSVDGTGQNSGSTEGKDILNVYGKFFGHVRNNNNANDIIVRYGTKYVATKCEVLVADIGLLSQNILGNIGHIRCETVEGVGHGLSLTVTIGSSSGSVDLSQTSDLFDADISYQAPIVADYQGPGSKSAYTYGGQTIIVRGANFGPLNTVVEKAIYGKNKEKKERKTLSCFLYKLSFLF